MTATDTTAAEQIYRQALAALSEGIVVQNKDGAITSCNPAAERILGLSEDQMKGVRSTDPLWGAVHEDGSPFPGEEHPAMVTLRTGTPQENVIMGVHKPDGSLSWISINSMPFRAGSDGAGEDAVVTTFTDVTDRFRVEVALRASEERFRTGVEALLDGFAICSPVRDEAGDIIDFRWEYANEASCRRNRLSREQMIGHRIGEVIPGYPASKLFEQHRRVALTGVAETVGELWFEGEWASGEQVSAAYEGSVVPLGANIIITARDITERKRAELEQRRLATVVESSTDAIFSTDRDCLITTWNPGAERHYGYTAGEIVGKHVGLLMPSERAGEEQEMLDRVLSGESVNQYETQRVAKDGTAIDVAITVSPIRGASGEVIGAASIERDVGEQKRAREELRKSEALFRGGFEHSPIGMMLTNLDGRFERVNGAFARMVGYDDPQELAGFDFASLTHPDDISDNREGIRAMIEDDAPYRDVKRYLRRDGSTVCVILGSTVVRDDDGSPIAFFTQVEDITERKQAEAALRASEERFQAAVGSMLDAFTILSPVRDDEGGIVDFCWEYVNDAYCELVGFDRGQLIGHRLGELLPGFPASERFALYRRVLETGEPCLTVDVAEPEAWAGGLVASRALDTMIVAAGENVVVTARDVTERHRLEEQLRASEERFRGGFEHSPIGMTLTNLDGTLERVNAAFARMLGYEDPQELAGVNFVSLTHPDDVDVNLDGFRAMLEQDRPYTAEKRYLRRDGEVVTVIVGSTAVRDDEGHPVALFTQAEDITDRKRAEQELTLQAELLDLAHDAVIVRDPVESRVRFWNREAEAIYGYSRQEALGMVTHELLATVFQSWESVDDALAREGQWVGELRHTRKDGTLIVVSSRQALQRDGDGEPIAIIELNSDITELKRAAEYARSLIEASLDPLVTISAEGKITDVNDATMKVTGVERDGLLGTDFGDYFTEPERAREGYQRVFSEGAVIDYPLTIRRRDGVLTDVLYNATVYRDSAGEVLGVFAAARDVTERRRAEQELAHMSDLLERTQEISKTGGWEYEVATSRLTWTDEVYRIYGVELASDPTEVTSAIAAYDPESRPVIDAAFGRLVTAGEPYDLELGLIRGDGQRIWVRTSGRPVIEDGRVVRVGGNIVDITDRRKAEEEIRKLNAELEQRVADRTAELERVNRELETFAYSVSHDLRAPLRAVSGFSQALLEDYAEKLGEEGRHDLERVSAGALRMGSLIDAVLELSRLSRRRLVRVHVDLSALAREVVDELRTGEPDRRVEVEIQDGLRAEADRDLVRIVLENLLANAFKFTSKTADARIRFGTAEQDAVAVYFVADNGAGFDMAHSEWLFLPFHRLHRDDEFPGEGIGLATVVRTVRKHGGVIWAQGAVNEGATFYFSLTPGAYPPASAATGEDVIPSWQPPTREDSR